MTIYLASSLDLPADYAAKHSEHGLVALLHEGESALIETLQAKVDTPILVDIHGPTLSRVNFDAVELLIADLTPETLLSAGGRRLMDALGHLAQEGELSLAFAGDATAVTGLLLEDGITAGLNLIPRTVIIPDVQAVPSLAALLGRASEQGVRLLALDAPVVAAYEPENDMVSVQGAGSALLASFLGGDNGERPTARLHALTDGMRDGWPA
ncbi:MAG: hypothetical protein H6642_05355 [Caldilineaceae bacterium]|nr:hypothetical protein [Caldilineaceae bacterium]